MFFVRRMVWITALQAKLFPLKMAGVMFVTIWQLSMYIENKPFVDKTQQKLEVFNEVVVLLIMYFLPLFSDWIPDVK